MSTPFLLIFPDDRGFRKKVSDIFKNTISPIIAIRCHLFPATELPGMFRDQRASLNLGMHKNDSIHS